MSTLKVNNIVAYSGTHVSGTFSGVFSGSFNSSRIDALEAFSSSLDNTFATDLVVNSLSGAFNSFTAALDNTYATDAQLYQLYQATRSIELTTGSLIGITNGLMAFTAALDSTYATDAQLLPILQATASLNTYTSSNDSVRDRILQTTASLNSKTGSFATTGSNLFRGDETISGSLNIIINEPSIGDILQGGKVAYILTSSDAGYDSNFIKGIIAAEADEANSTWYDATASIDSKTTNGYTDWYLPSISELRNLYINRVAIGGFFLDVNGRYWSSTEWIYDVDSVEQIIFSDGTQPVEYKSIPYYPSRAIRQFSILKNALNVIGNQTITGSLKVSGSVNIDNVIKLAPVTNFPSGQAGMLVASASYGKTNLYVYDGSNWKWLVTGSIA